MSSYGLPAGTAINYGGAGFPAWVYELGRAFNLKASTYPGHQESDRNEAGYARNPDRLNRGIDWAGSVADMERFANYCMSIRGELEQVIWQNPITGRRVGVAGGKDVSATAYFASDYPDHRDHAHTRQSKPIPIPGAGSTNQEKTVGWQGDPVWLETVLREALGDRLVVWDGWADRGTGGQMGDIWGVMIHHTGNSRERPEVIRDGIQQSGGYLPGPLSQCLIAPDGKCHLVAVGPCNHAGAGSYPGLGNGTGNQRTIGIECAWPNVNADGSYDKNQRWPDAQIITMRDASAAIVKRLGYRGDRVIGHKTYAGSAQGKWDPGNLDIPWFQGEVNLALDGKFTAPPVVVPPPVGAPGNPVPPPVLPPPDNPRSDRVLLTEIWDQLRILWPQLGDTTLVNHQAELGRKVDALNAKLEVVIAALADAKAK